MQLVASLIGQALWNHAGHENVFGYGALFAVLVSLNPTGLKP